MLWGYPHDLGNPHIVCSLFVVWTRIRAWLNHSWHFQWPRLMHWPRNHEALSTWASKPIDYGTFAQRFWMFLDTTEIHWANISELHSMYIKIQICGPTARTHSCSPDPHPGPSAVRILKFDEIWSSVDNDFLQKIEGGLSVKPPLLMLKPAFFMVKLKLNQYFCIIFETPKLAMDK